MRHFFSLLLFNSINRLTRANNRIICSFVMVYSFLVQIIYNSE